MNLNDFSTRSEFNVGRFFRNLIVNLFVYDSWNCFKFANKNDSSLRKSDATNEADALNPFIDEKITNGEENNNNDNIISPHVASVEANPTIKINYISFDSQPSTVTVDSTSRTAADSPADEPSLSHDDNTNNDEDDIDLNQLIPTFIENMRKQQADILTSELAMLTSNDLKSDGFYTYSMYNKFFKCSKKSDSTLDRVDENEREEQEAKNDDQTQIIDQFVEPKAETGVGDISTSVNTLSMNSRQLMNKRKSTIDDYFYQKMFSAMIKDNLKSNQDPKVALKKGKVKIHNNKKTIITHENKFLKKLSKRSVLNLHELWTFNRNRTFYFVAYNKQVF